MISGCAHTDTRTKVLLALISVPDVYLASTLRPAKHYSELLIYQVAVTCTFLV
jgi:hypothetical protein